MAVAVAVADDPAGRAVMVAGATGLVGRAVLAALLADKNVRAVHTVGRRATRLAHPKLTHHAVADLSHLPRLPLVNDVFIALGTTIKLAGSQAAFRAVDLSAAHEQRHQRFRSDLAAPMPMQCRIELGTVGQHIV